MLPLTLMNVLARPSRGVTYEDWTHLLEILVKIYSNALANFQLQFTTHALDSLGLLSHTSPLLPASKGRRSPSCVPELSRPTATATISTPSIFWNYLLSRSVLSVAVPITDPCCPISLAYPTETTAGLYFFVLFLRRIIATGSYCGKLASMGTRSLSRCIATTTSIFRHSAVTSQY